ncbi:DNA alkylation repair protein [Rhizobium sp. C4]|uniref:DNA alkylation repair protein n=1 Tax=Rhizobium sp. C4 TaxID=1349800 RepID=UPI001E4DD2A2|nr:DNA alkylation repair protein [Rhizobium sp. C4]MCD2171581.1 DNA alkylation repair protein [Rhizobium sp. C4]
MDLNPASSVADIVATLKSLGNATNVAGMARFGIETSTALGISTDDMRRIARLIKKDHARALDLWRSDIREARLLAAMTAEPRKLSLEQAWSWAGDFNSWEVVDTVSDLFVESGHWPVLIPEFAADEREFVRRTAFSMMAWAAVHLKKEPDAHILAFLPLIERHAGDPRNFVKKAVNWALRQIGKRNVACREPAWALAERLAASKDKTERWVGKDAVREFEKKFGDRIRDGRDQSDKA